MAKPRYRVKPKQLYLVTTNDVAAVDDELQEFDGPCSLDVLHVVKGQRNAITFAKQGRGNVDFVVYEVREIYRHKPSS